MHFSWLFLIKLDQILFCGHFNFDLRSSLRESFNSPPISGNHLAIRLRIIKDFHGFVFDLNENFLLECKVSGPKMLMSGSRVKVNGLGPRKGSPGCKKQYILLCHYHNNLIAEELEAQRDAQYHS
jgi:hypothetical protein